MTAADLDAVLAIEQVSFPDPWPRRFFAEEAQKPGLVYARVARSAGRAIGYLVAWFVLDEIHLGNLAVDRDHRRRGVAHALLADLFHRGRRRGSSFITLEVRAGNQGAIALYSSLDFQPVAVRKGYYAGKEDAVIMVREFSARGGQGKERRGAR
jgi:ribosomal-protein-alanine N-acetyltransferase